jgi:hypothetical protein
MNKQLSIVEVLYNHKLYPAFLKEDQFDFIQAAVKDILKQYTEIVMENAVADVEQEFTSHMAARRPKAIIRKGSIRNCLKLVKYE